VEGGGGGHLRWLAGGFYSQWGGEREIPMERKREKCLGEGPQSEKKKKILLKREGARKLAREKETQ